MSDRDEKKSTASTVSISARFDERWEPLRYVPSDVERTSGIKSYRWQPNRIRFIFSFSKVYSWSSCHLESVMDHIIIGTFLLMFLSSPRNSILFEQ